MISVSVLWLSVLVCMCVPSKRGDEKPEKERARGCLCEWCEERERERGREGGREGGRHQRVVDNNDRKEEAWKGREREGGREGESEREKRKARNTSPKNEKKKASSQIPQPHKDIH